MLKNIKMEAPSENKNTEKIYSIISVRSQQLLLIIDGYKSNGTIYTTNIFTERKILQNRVEGVCCTFAPVSE